MFTLTYVLNIGTIFGPDTEPLKATWPATPIIMQNLVFLDYTMKMTVEAPVYFSIVLSLKAYESN